MYRFIYILYIILFYLLISLIQATEALLQLNGDGFGVSWYVNDISPYPAIFTETTPAWSNANLRYPILPHFLSFLVMLMLLFQGALENNKEHLHSNPR